MACTESRTPTSGTAAADAAPARPCERTFGECVERHCAADDNPYVAAARAMIGVDDEHEIDDKTVVSESDEGAWVMNWVWIPKSDIESTAQA